MVKQMIICKVSEIPRVESLSTRKQLYYLILQIIPTHEPQADALFRYDCFL